MHVRLGRQAGADIEELPDARLGHQPGHGPVHERPVGADITDHSRPDRDDRFGRLPVSSEVVLAAQPVVIDPGRMRHISPEVNHAMVWRRPRNSHAQPHSPEDITTPTSAYR